MKVSTSRTITATLACTLCAALASCGPKPDVEEPAGGDTGGESGDDPADEAEPARSTLADLVDQLNRAIDEGNEASAYEIIEEDTIDILIEAVDLLPEWEPAGDEIGLVDYLDWEKQNGVVFVLEDEDVEAGTGMLVGQIDGLDEFEGEISVVEDEGTEKLEFFDLASGRRDEILSLGLKREKYIEVVDGLNKAIEELDVTVFQNSLTNDTLNNELKYLSYQTKKKSNWSVKGILKRMHNLGYQFEVNHLNMKTGEATLVVTDGDGEEVRNGPVKFKTEIGHMRLDYADYMQGLIDEAEEKKQQKGKKGKKGK